MKLFFLATLLAVLCAASASGQSIRTLGYNTTNGQVVANTGTNTLTFTNAGVAFGGDMTISGPVIAGSGVSFSFEDADFAYGAPLVRINLGFSTNLNTFWTATNSSNARSAVGLGATWLTNTNVTNFRTAIGLGTTNQVQFGAVYVGTYRIEDDQFGGLTFVEPVNEDTVLKLTRDDSPVYLNPNYWNDAGVRSNIGLPLPALTQTSNVLMMRALAGSTNTNEPYSGSISVTGTNNTNTLVFTNGILREVTTP